MISPFLRPLQAIISLTKPIITLSVAFSAFTGFILYQQSLSGPWLMIWLGVLFIAGGSSSINQIQESGFDKLMKRTSGRVLPSGRLKQTTAILLAIIFSITGAIILWIFGNHTAALLAVFTLVWYNGIYTPLKRATPWAIFPGAVVGAIPPAIGYTAAGGLLTEPAIIIVALFFFIGQIPHFWLILLRHGDDYHNAGFPSATDMFSKRTVSRLTFLWTFATAVTAMFLTVTGIITGIITGSVTVVLSVLLVVLFARWPGTGEPLHVNRAFIIMNTYFLSIMLLIIFDSIFKY